MNPGTGTFGAGDLDGDGFAVIRPDAATGQVCFRLPWSDIDDPVAAHIHSGVVALNGPVVVDLLNNADGIAHEGGEGRASGCAEDVDPALLDDIGNHPGAYYLNVHTARFPGGAIRGTLERKEVV